MAHKNVGEWIVTVGNSHLEERENSQGHKFKTRVPDPDTKHRVRLEIDLEKVMAHIGASAVKGKSGKSKYMGGAIVATDLSRGGR